MKFADIIKAAIKVAKANPTLVMGAVAIGKQVVKAVKAETKKPKV